MDAWASVGVRSELGMVLGRTRDCGVGSRSRCWLWEGGGRESLVVGSILSNWMLLLAMLVSMQAKMMCMG